MIFSSFCGVGSKSSSNSDLQLLDADELGQFFDFAFVQFAETEFEDFLQIDGQFVQGFGLGMRAGNSRNHADQQTGSASRSMYAVNLFILLLLKDANGILLPCQ